MAAKPTLASNLISKNTIGYYYFSETTKKRLRVGTGVSEIDDALSGGFVFGEDGVYNVSGGEGTRGVEILSLQILITHLLASPLSKATLLDTTGNFDPLLLSRLLLSRLSKTNNNHETNVKTATAILDRVNIMRVFDFEGVVEGLDELSEGLEGKSVLKDVIGDSQEEADDEEVSCTEAEEKEKEQAHPQPGMILINNLSQVLGLLLKNNYAQGQATMATLIRRLRNMAQQHNLCVILLSWSVSYGSEQERVSIFDSIKARPGLGKSLGYLVDTQILVDAIPRKARSKGINDLVNVIEVVHSRGSHQAGEFGVFDMTADGEIEPVS